MNYEKWNPLLRRRYQKLENGDKKRGIAFAEKVKKTWGCLQKASGIIVENKYFRTAILLLIILNAIQLGLGTYEFPADGQIDLNNLFSRLDTIFLRIFTVELILNAIFHTWRLFLDGWLFFDLVTIILSYVFRNMTVVRVFRVFRALRLIEQIEILRNLVSALIMVIPSMASIILLMVLTMYIFAVMFTSLFSDMDGLEDNYFLTLHDTFFTLFQMLTLDWGEIAREVMAQRQWARYPFIAYILISGFIVYNLIVAVLCEALNELGRDSEIESVLKDEDGSKLKRRINGLSIRVKQAQETQKKLHSCVEDLILMLNELDKPPKKTTTDEKDITTIKLEALSAAADVL